MVAVIQGFGPFGGFSVNPAELLVRSLGQPEREHSGGVEDDLVTAVLPVSKDRVPGMIAELMSLHRPDLWLGVGLAAGRTALSIEAVAVNLMHWPASQADADGQSADRRPVAEDGPDAYLTTVPVEDILRAWREHGIPGYLSHSAGSYIEACRTATDGAGLYLGSRA